MKKGKIQKNNAIVWSGCWRKKHKTLTQNGFFFLFFFLNPILLFFLHFLFTDISMLHQQTSFSSVSFNKPQRFLNEKGGGVDGAIMCSAFNLRCCESRGSGMTSKDYDCFSILGRVQSITQHFAKIVCHFRIGFREYHK